MNRTEQNRTEQNRTEQNRTEQNIIPDSSVNIYKQNLYQTLVEILSVDDRLVSEGKLIKNKVIELSLNLDSQLLKHLIKNTSLKKHFFSDIDGTLVFDKIKFQKFVNNKQFLPDSYTSFKNKIGLVSNDEYLSESKNVVLAFPYKDCVLEGGQDKEDAKREEIFWNETLAPDQIDRLLSPKVLTNFKRYTKDGEEQVASFNENDNLIIKGNNLIVLHTLINKYRGKVKLIYIDPPYNTGSDSFKYNDSFNHSTWLTFMKNRLEVARKFLKENGIICVQCSFHEFAYIKIVMDEIFPKCLVALNIQVRHPDRILNGDKEYNDVIEYILIYSNTSSAKMPKRIEEKTDDEYIYSIKEIGNPEIIYLDKKRVEIYTPEKYALITQKPNKLLTKKISIRGALREKNSSGRFYVKNIEPIKNQYPPETIFKVERVGDDHFGFRYFYTPSKKNKNGGYLQGKPISSNITEKQYPNFLNYELDYNRVSPEGDVLFRNGKKPESLLSFLISMFTQEKDIVLDYHLGSGTTAAVAQKINRQYICIEQMDYIEHLTIKRLSNVLNGEKSGISKSVNWQGGGSFVYCELAKANQIFIETIQAAKSTEELITIWNEMQDKAFLSYQFNKKSFEELRANFWELTISEQKKFLIEILDKNMLYVPLSEIDDQTYKITESDKILNKHFFD